METAGDPKGSNFYYYLWGSLQLSGGAIAAGAEPFEMRAAEHRRPYSRNPLDHSANPQPPYPQVEVVMYTDKEGIKDLSAEVEKSDSWLIPVKVDADEVLSTDAKLQLIARIAQAIATQTVVYEGDRRESLAEKVAEVSWGIQTLFSMVCASAEERRAIEEQAVAREDQSKNSLRAKRFKDWVTNDLIMTFFGEPQSPEPQGV
jgi:hypothetical protein